MDQNDRMLLRKALTQAFAEKFEEELAVCSETAECSEQHVTAMKAILLQGICDEQTAERKSRKKWLVAFLVAAAMLLTAITVGAYHNEIQAFCERVYEKYIHLTFDYGEENQGEFRKYTLGFVPEGYSLQRQESTSESAYYQWKNEEGEYLVFEQFALSVFNSNMDNEAGESIVRQYGKYEVYCRLHETGICTYIWNDGNYAYTLDSSKELPEEFLSNIINSIIIAE